MCIEFALVHERPFKNKSKGLNMIKPCLNLIPFLFEMAYSPKEVDYHGKYYHQHWSEDKITTLNNLKKLSD
jgi:hypothetical protein